MKVTVPVFVKDLATANELIATARHETAVNIFVLNHKDAVKVIEQLGNRVTIQPVKQFGNEVYVEAPNKLTNDLRQKHIKKLAGQVFRATYEGVESLIEVTNDGLFKCLADGKSYEAPSTAISKGWYGRVKGRGQVNGWFEAKNDRGNSITDELKKYIQEE